MTDAELISLVKEAEEDGTLKEDESELVRSALEFDGSAETLNMEFTLPDGTNNLRLVLEADDGSIFKINNVKMYLKSDM